MAARGGGLEMLAGDTDLQCWGPGGGRKWVGFR